MEPTAGLGQRGRRVWFRRQELEEGDDASGLGGGAGHNATLVEFRCIVQLL
jgi:hypothetical protein